jgi:hypothetical protein
VELPAPQEAAAYLESQSGQKLVVAGREGRRCCYGTLQIYTYLPKGSLAGNQNENYLL